MVLGDDEDDWAQTVGKVIIHRFPADLLDMCRQYRSGSCLLTYAEMAMDSDCGLSLGKQTLQPT